MDRLALVLCRYAVGLPQSVLGNGEAMASSELTDLPVSLFVNFVDVSSRMIQVEADCGKSNLSWNDPTVNQSFTQLTVFTTVAHPLVETVDSNEIVLPSRGIVAIPSWVRGREAIKNF